MKNNNYYDVTTGKQAELSPLQKMYLELEKVIKPRLLGDFCGYNEEIQGFDIVLATKEIIEAKEQECEAQRRKIDYYIKKTTQLLDGIDNYKQAIDEIEKYLDAQQQYLDGEDYHNLLDIINKAKENWWFLLT